MMRRPWHAKAIWLTAPSRKPPRHPNDVTLVSDFVAGAYGVALFVVDVQWNSNE
jgi:hypothetical protein